MSIHVYTDGACKGNPGKGGWGWVEYHKNMSFYDYGGERQTTNCRMELKAVIEFLKHAPEGKSYVIHSDCEYVLKGLVKNGNGTLRVPGIYSGWMGKWLVTRFKKNEEYWKALDILIRRHLKNKTKLYFCWVKGHSGDVGNDQADLLANIWCAEN